MVYEWCYFWGIFCSSITHAGCWIDVLQCIVWCKNHRYCDGIVITGYTFYLYSIALWANLWFPPSLTCFFYFILSHTQIHSLNSLLLSTKRSIDISFPSVITTSYNRRTHSYIFSVCVCRHAGDNVSVCVLLILSIVSSLIISPPPRHGHQLLRGAIIWNWFSPPPHLEPGSEYKMLLWQDSRMKANDKGLSASEALQFWK